MARCGCAAGCACLVTGSGPVAVSGNGSPGAPFTVAIAHGDRTGCAGIAACVGDWLGAGLIYDEATGTLQARISRDPSNNLTFGSDNGLFSSGGGGGGGGPFCQKSVTSLPASPGVVGALAMAGLINPYNSPYGADYCVANDIDIVHFRAATTGDGVAAVTEYLVGSYDSSRSSIYESSPVRYLDSATVKSVWNYAGDTNSPFPQAVTNRVNNGGWYGWLAPNYYQPLLPEMLKRLDGKAVALIECSDLGQPDNIEADNVQAALRAIREECAQEWAMIGVQLPANAATVANAGVEPVMMALDWGSWGTATLPWAVSAVTGAGANWVVLSNNYADAVFTAYVNAGLNVLMAGGLRHKDRARVTALGLRGFLSLDPVYTRGPAVHDYRKIRDPWSQRRMGNGQLTYQTDQQSVSGTIVRGYHRAPTSPSLVGPEGFMLPARFGDGGASPSVLVGWECPLQVPTAYTITWDMLFDTLPTSNVGKLGLIIGMPTDNDTFLYSGSSGNPFGMPVPIRNGYRVYQRVDGVIAIGIFNAAGVYSDLATVTTPVPSSDVWNTYSVQVTATTVVLRRTTTNGTTYTATATNNVWRGPYFAVEKEELHSENSQYGFIGGFRNLTVSGQGDS